MKIFINDSQLRSFSYHFHRTNVFVFKNKLLQKKKKKIKNKEQQKQLHYRNERSELQGKRAGTKTLENKYL